MKARTPIRSRVASGLVLCAPVVAIAIALTGPARTVVSIVGRTPAGQKVTFSDGPTNSRTISVTFTHGDPPVSSTASITVSSGSHSRAEMAHALMEAVVEEGGQVEPHGSAEDSATSFTIKDTPAEYNAGTADSPEKQPGFDTNKPSAQSYTKS